MHTAAYRANSLKRPSGQCCTPKHLFQPSVPQRRCRRHASAVRANASSEESQFKLAPSKPTTPFGEMMAYYLQMEPDRFNTAVEAQFERLKEEKDTKQALPAEDTSSSSESDDASPTSSTDLVLSELSDRIQQVQDAERRATVEDLMYMCILEEFIKLGIGMLPKMDNYLDLESVTLKPLMDGIHTREALEMVREHMLHLLGQAATLPPTVTLKMSKLQMAQVYAASVMFGYFLRRVDSRYQLAKQLNMLPTDSDDVVVRLERLFALSEDHPVEGSSVGADAPGADSESAGEPGEPTPVLKKYIESFDEATMRSTARFMSREAATLLERQASALWGDAKELQKGMQQAIGVDATSVEEVLKRAEQAVKDDKVETVTMSLSTQRRAILEAVAYGTFLRDVENRVDLEYGLLTPLPSGGEGGSGPAGLLEA